MVIDFLVNMSASADVLAQAKVEVDLSAIPLGKNVSSALLSTFLPPRPPDPPAKSPAYTACVQGHNQMARETRFHPSSNPRGNKRRRRYQMGNPTRSPAGLGSCQESRMAHNAGYWFLFFSHLLSFFLASPLLYSQERKIEKLINMGLI